MKYLVAHVTVALNPISFTITATSKPDGTYTYSTTWPWGYTDDHVHPISLNSPNFSNTLTVPELGTFEIPRYTVGHDAANASNPTPLFNAN